MQPDAREADVQLDNRLRAVNLSLHPVTLCSCSSLAINRLALTTLSGVTAAAHPLLDTADLRKQSRLPSRRPSAAPMCELTDRAHLQAACHGHGIEAPWGRVNGGQAAERRVTGLCGAILEHLRCSDRMVYDGGPAHTAVLRQGMVSCGNNMKSRGMLGACLTGCQGSWVILVPVALSPGQAAMASPPLADQALGNNAVHACEQASPPVANPHT